MVMRRTFNNLFPLTLPTHPGSPDYHQTKYHCWLMTKYRLVTDRELFFAQPHFHLVFYDRVSHRSRYTQSDYLNCILQFPVSSFHTAIVLPVLKALPVSVLCGRSTTAR